MLGIYLIECICKEYCYIGVYGCIKYYLIYIAVIEVFIV